MKPQDEGGGGWFAGLAAQDAPATAEKERGWFDTLATPQGFVGPGPGYVPKQLPSTLTAADITKASFADYLAGASGVTVEAALGLAGMLGVPGAKSARESIQQGIAGIAAPEREAVRALSEEMNPFVRAGMRIGAPAGSAGAFALTLPAGPWAIGAQGAAAEGTGLYYEAKANGASPLKAWTAFGIGLGLGATEAAGLGRVGKVLEEAGAGSVLRRTLLAGISSGAEESVQEAVQTIGGNLTAKGLWDPEQGWAEGVTDAMIAAAFLGSTGGAAAGAGAASNARAAEQAETAQAAGAEAVEAMKPDPERATAPRTGEVQAPGGVLPPVEIGPETDLGDQAQTTGNAVPLSVARAQTEQGEFQGLLSNVGQRQGKTPDEILEGQTRIFYAQDPEAEYRAVLADWGVTGKQAKRARQKAGKAAAEEREAQAAQEAADAEAAAQARTDALAARKSVGDFVELPDGRRGTVTLTKGGRLEVALPDGSTVYEDPRRAVLIEPKAAAQTTEPPAAPPVQTEQASPSPPSAPGATTTIAQGGTGQAATTEGPGGASEVEGEGVTSVEPDAVDADAAEPAPLPDEATLKKTSAAKLRADGVIGKGAAYPTKMAAVEAARAQAAEAEHKALVQAVGGDERAARTVSDFVAANEAKAKPVESPTDEHKAIVGMLGKRGVKAVFVATEDGKPLSRPGMYRDGVAVLDAARPAAGLRRVAYHELAHHLKRVLGVEWKQLYEELKKYDRSGLRRALKKYRDAAKAQGVSLETVEGGKRSEFARGAQEEAVSQYVEDIGAYLDEAFADPARLLRLSQRNPTLFQRIVEAVQNFLAKAGVGGGSQYRRDLAALKRMTEAEFSLPPKELAAIALRVREALDQAAGVTPPQVSEDGKFALANPTPDSLGFYSGLERAVSTKIQGKRATAKQVRALLDKGEVKQEEWYWALMDDFLAKSGERVETAELLDWIRANAPVVREVVLGRTESDTAGWTADDLGGKRWLVRDQRGREMYEIEDAVTPERAIFLAGEKHAEFRGMHGSERPKFEQYTLPGGENYREVLLVLPSLALTDDIRAKIADLNEKALKAEDRGAAGIADGYRRDIERLRGTASQFTGGHFSQPNVLAHIRLNDRTDADGNRVLFVEEIQSDWHQEGRKKGYGGKDRWAIYRKPSASQEEFVGYGETEADAQSMVAELKAERPDRWFIVRKESWKQGPPDAPWKRDWHTLALKRAVTLAATNGYDALGWTTGRQQVERYEDSMRRAVDSIEWSDLGGGVKQVTASKDGSGVWEEQFDERGVSTRGDGKTVEDYMGKSIGRRILSEDSGSVSGPNLTIGGKGMEGFYDQMLPAAANKIGKRYGARASRGSINTGFKAGHTVKKAVDGQFYVYASDGGAIDASPAFASREDAFAWIKTPDGRAALGVANPIHTLPLTPALREAAATEGFARFALDDQGRPFTRQEAQVEKATRKAAREGEMTGVGSTPGPLASTSEDVGVRALNRGVREVRGYDYTPEKVKDWRAVAQERLRVDYNGEKADILAKMEAGELLDKYETLMADQIRTDSGMRALTKGDPKAYADAIKFGWLYQDSRAEIAKALRAVEDAMGQTRTGRDHIAELVGTPPRARRRRINKIKARIQEIRAKSLGRGGRFALTEAEQAELDALNKKLQAMLEKEASRHSKINGALVEAGFPPTLITADYYKDTGTWAKVSRTISTSRAGFWDKVIELRMANMLSAPLSHVKNTAGSWLYHAYRHHFSRWAEAMVNLAVRDANSTTFRELKDYYTSYLPAVMRAFRTLALSARHDMPVFEHEMTAAGYPTTGMQRIDSIKGPAIGGKLGRIIRAPSLTMLTAEDQFWKTLVYFTEAHALAYREATKAGLKGEARDIRVDEILENPHHPVHEEALFEADVVTFQDQVGKGLRGAMDLRNAIDELPFFFGVPVGRFAFPFVKTPGKLYQRGLEAAFMPLVTLSRAVTGKYPTRGKMMSDVGRSVVTFGAAMAILQLLLDRDENDLPRITGSVPWRESDIAYRTAPPYSIRIGDSWHSYRGLAPASVAIASMVDLMNKYLDTEDPTEAVWHVAQNIPNQAKDETFLRTAGDIWEALTEENQSRTAKAGRLARETFVTPFVPNIIKSAMRAEDPYFRATLDRPTDERTKEQAIWSLDSLKYQAFPTRHWNDGTIPAVKRDLWGRPIKRGGSNMIVRMLNPLPEVGEGDPLPIDILIRNWNAKVERGEVTDGQKFHPRLPDYGATVKGERVYFNATEYDNLVKRTGERAKERLLTMIQSGTLNVEDPKQRDIDRINDVLISARAYARRIAIRERRERLRAQGSATP